VGRQIRLAAAGGGGRWAMAFLIVWNVLVLGILVYWLAFADRSMRGKDKTTVGIVGFVVLGPWLGVKLLATGQRLLGRSDVD
jgi:hypothetical protein